jgi:3-hydroxyacyl-CoA dehydrogenase
MWLLVLDGQHLQPTSKSVSNESDFGEAEWFAAVRNGGEVAGIVGLLDARLAREGVLRFNQANAQPDRPPEGSCTMPQINDVTNLSLDNDVVVISLNSPPVNALSAAVRDGLWEAFRQANEMEAATAIVLICEGRTFIAGADITEFGGGGATAKGLHEVQDIMEASSKPVVAAIHGTALGGGLEVALCAHYRIAVPSAKCGLPEVNLGLLPGAGGTQRLPRIVGATKALEMMTAGTHVPASQCLVMGLVDELAEEGNLLPTAIAYARRLVSDGRPLVKVSLDSSKVEADRGNAELFAAFRKANAKKFRGFQAPESIIQCVEAAVNLPFDEGIAVERKLFLELVTGQQSAAQRYVFFAEREIWKIPGVPKETPVIPVNRVGVIGAGTMGGGITMNFVNAGIPVTIVETKQEALDRGLAVVRANYERSAKNGRFPIEDVERRMGMITGVLELEALADVDMVIEAVFERMDIKKEIFGKLDAICKPGAVLASNTSALDINEIASATTRPESVIGMHFFSPANVMKLLEVVRAEKTSLEVINTSMQIAKKIGKIAGLVGVCHGFVGNRMLFQRGREAQALLDEGCMPWEVDQALFDFGFAMGPFQMSDLAGLDIGWVKEKSNGGTIRDRLCELDRRGQKSGAGYYDYDTNRNPTPSAVTEEIIREFAAKSGRPARSFTQDEIVERLVYPMINEGAKILEEGIAIRPSDIDIIWINGYNWPAYRGGPMFYADQIGLDKVLARLKEWEVDAGPQWKPAALLESLVAEGKKFSTMRA